ncbi:MAG: thioredoxin-disulfide reductase [Chloroflexi bacterium]|nr:thioredoxin-disulfide reductase [Chloroflexota bacterium]MDA1147444.1 thioredoxin-disulfide reductase [Chloroflexota bacterium]
MEDVDVAIIGGGPTGLAAALYTARAKRRTVVWERGVLGGQIAITGTVENYPGFPDGVEGPILALDMHRQAEQFGMETKYEGITRITREPVGPQFVLEADSGSYRAKTVIVAAGADPVKLNVPGEEQFTGKGVSYCATCDGAFFKDEIVAVVGGGDAAVEEAIFLTRYASQVHIIHRRDELRASRILQDRARANDKIAFIWNTVVETIAGDTDVDEVTLHDLQTDERRTLAVGGVFIFIGHHPNSELLGDLAKLDEGGHAFVNLWMETEQPGFYVAGDVRVDSARQLASAVGDGVTAAIRSEHYLQHQFD